MRNKFFKNFLLIGLILVVAIFIVEIVFLSLSLKNDNLTLNKFIYKILLTTLFYAICFISLVLCYQHKNKK